MTKIFFNKVKAFFKKKYLFYLISLLILLISFFPRSVEVLNQNPIFGFDQGREMLAARNIVVNHKLILIGTELGAGSAGISGIFHGPFYYYLLTIPFVLFNGNPNGGTFFMFVFGLFTILLSYVLGKKILGKSGGIIFAILVALSPILISQSRFLWSPNLSSFFIILSFYFIYKLGESKRKIFLASFFTAFIYNFEMATAVPLCITLFIYSLFVFKKKINLYLILFLGYVTGFLPMILFELRHNFLAIRGIYSYVFLHEGTNVTLLFLQNMFFDHVMSFFYNFKDTFILNDSRLTSLLLIIVLATMVFYVAKEKKISIRNFNIFLLLLILITFVVFMFLRNTVYTFYLVDLSFAYMFFFTYVFVKSFKEKKLKIFIVFSLFFISVFFLGVKNSIINTKQDYFDYGGTAKLKGKIEAIDYIYKSANTKPFNLLVFSPPVYTYPYDYLLLWYGKEKYGFVPGNEKKGIFYLLIEKDNSKPWSYEGWLKTVIKSGEILETKILQSGFIIQKRQEKL